ncbi:hypothetical protein AAC387_Pa01g2538 [Persea americana]
MESKVKRSTFTSPTKDYPTINLKEDVDVNFSSFMNAVTNVVVQPLSNESNEVAVNGVTIEAQSMLEKLDDVGVNTTFESTPTSACPRHKIRPMERGTMEMFQLKGCNGFGSTGLDGSHSIQDNTFVDTMVPKVAIAEGVDSSIREMWPGHEFPDLETFRIGIAKHAIYNNFTLKHIKMNIKMVTACCKDDNCSWRIHSTIVDSGPQFKVRKYNLNHSCSKPMMGTTHKQASAQLIAESVEGKIRCNNDFRPTDIINE